MKKVFELATALAHIGAGPGQELTRLQIFPETTYPGAVDHSIAAGAQFGQSSDPFYPSPWMSPEVGGWEGAYLKAKDFVSQLTLMEKINLTTGVG
jgi:beta-glucosidase